ncbi:MAG TPA: MarR family transcriptional regulator [Candidatus Acidoferrales bacterium]|nr:MarR family transcriptional regulator [Candidatus Acidoferrales bacterium]
MAKKMQTEELAERLHSTAIHLLRLVRVEDRATGIAPARLSALSVIVLGGPVSLGDLARAEQVRPPTMSRIVDALEAEGLARRRANQQDRRTLLIEATEKGVAILKQGRKRRVKFLASYLSQLANSELVDIERAVRAIEKALAQQ